MCVCVCASACAHTVYVCVVGDEYLCSVFIPTSYPKLHHQPSPYLASLHSLDFYMQLPGGGQRLMTVLVSRPWPGQALGAMCSFWETYINTDWGEEEKGGVCVQWAASPGCRERRQSRAHFPSSHPSPLVCSCWAGKTAVSWGREEGRRLERMRFCKLGIPPPLLNEGGEGK